MQSRKKREQIGASLTEVLMVLAVAAVLVVIAVPRFGSATNNLSRQNIAREFKVDLERARFDSVKRRAGTCSDMSRVTVNRTSFSVTTDLNQNGTLETAETQTVNFAGRSDVTIVGYGVALPVTIRFDERGRAVLSDCVSVPPANIPLFFFCNGSCGPETANAQNSNVIFVSPTGTVAMLNGGQTMPTFGNPSVTNVNANTQINPMLAVWQPATATATPSATSTPSPTNTPTPAPTATPYYCHVGSPWQSPAVDGCICQAPQWVRSNGQCK